MSDGGSPTPTRITTRRIALLDLLRLCAAFQMVQGHTIDAVLAPEFRSGTVFSVWSFLRGLTSVAFLAIAGLAFHLATLRDLARHRADRAASAKRFRRAGLLLLLGYAMHLPLAALTGGDPAARSAALAAGLAVDILQCMGVTLALLEGLVLLLPTRRAVQLACCALGAAVLVATPALDALDPSGPLLPLLDYFTARGGSLFPLLPWSAHMLLGAGLGGLLLDGERRGLRLGAAAVGLLALSALAGWLSAAPAAEHCKRLGLVLGFAALLAPLEPLLARMPALLRRLAGETLFLYAFHVLLVYGQGLGLAAHVGAGLPPLASAALALCVLALSCAGALAYPRLFRGLAGRTATG